MSKLESIDNSQQDTSPTTLLIGTTKGLVVFKKKKANWILEKVHFLGMSISFVYNDPINQVWWVSISHHHWGQKLQYSKDQGTTWKTIPSPKYPSDAISQSGKPATLKKIWSIQQGGKSYPKRIWIGTEPGGLFLSEDYGNTFHLVESLWNHPSRMNRQQWFGTGRNQPYIHSIVIDPRAESHIYIAVSCAGIFESLDSGQSWEPKNKGLIAAYLPNPEAEIGHDPHLLLACQSEPDILWQQNHCGIFRTTTGGAVWENVTDLRGVANYGFAITIDHQNPNRAWVIPATSDEIRVAHDLALAVCYTEDAGKTWQAYRTGLPQQNSFDIVFRHAFDRKAETLVFGTTTGNVYLSENDGKSWQPLSHTLSRIDCVTLA